MKVGIDMRCFAGGRVSGVEEYARNVIERLIETSPEHTFVLFYNAFSSAPVDFSWATRHAHVSLKHTHWPNKLLNGLLWYFGRPHLDTFIGGVDVFFAPNLGFISVSKKCRLVVTAHDLSYEIYPETFSWKRRLWHLFVAPRKLYRRADAIIAISASTAEDLMTLYRLPKRKIHTILSGVSDRFHTMDRNNLTLIDVKKRYRLPYRSILFVGTFEPRKNLTALIRAYAEFRNAYQPQNNEQPPQLILAGSSGWKEEEMRGDILVSPYSKDIRRLGFVPEEDKPALYNLATVFVYPSLYEGFGFPVAEAMACGVPTITSRSSSLGEVAKNGAIMVDPLRPEEIAIALLELFRDADLRKELTRRSRIAVSHLSWRKCTKETKEVLTIWEKNG